jgi:hypothetical protein
MKAKIFLSLVVSFTIVSMVFAQGTVPASQDTIYIPGGTLSGGENAGNMETIINGDTTSSGARINPNRVYALYEGQVYFQLAPINVYNPTGTLTICGVPDPNNPTATEKPIILILPTNGNPVVINGGGVNMLYGSLKFDNIYYVTQEIGGTQENELFYLGTANKLPQSLTINNCLFEFSNIDLFDATNETGAIGGWPYGAKFKITNSYFRNLFYPGQWWGSRVFQCKHPTDTLWVENCTVTGGGLTFLQQNQLTDFTYINHNTIINNHKYWILSPYKHNEYITNNIFVNQNWVGEDTNVTNSGQDPDKLYMSTINIDTNNTTNGLQVQSKYYNADSSISSALSFDSMHVYISNNVNYNDPQIASGYYNNSAFVNSKVGTPPSYLTWSFSNPPYKIGNQPGEWMNSRTAAIFKQYAPPHGGFVEENTITTNPNMETPAIADASVVTLMGEWNQNLWGDPAYPNAPNITSSKYIFGDYSSSTLPGIINGQKSDNVTTNGTGIQVGITKFTDLTENFSQTTDISTIDNLPIGSLIWNDSQNNAYNSSHDFQLVMQHYLSLTPIAKVASTVPMKYSLDQNYPNPFNPSTTINFSVAKAGNVKLVIYNALGQEVRTLVDQDFSAGSHSIQWDGKDSHGMSVSSGLYIYRISAGTDFVAARKMVLLK